MAKTNQATYGRVTAALRELGFAPEAARSTAEHTVFVRADRPGSIILPVLDPNEVMWAAHLAMIRRVLAESDLADAERFDAVLRARGTPDSRGVPA